MIFMIFKVGLLLRTEMHLKKEKLVTSKDEKETTKKKIYRPQESPRRLVQTLNLERLSAPKTDTSAKRTLPKKCLQLARLPPFVEDLNKGKTMRARQRGG